MKTNKEIIAAVRHVTYAGMAINVAITIAKAAGGWLCASQALLADAVHSVSDLATDLAVVLGVRYWVAPADEEHPYGHGKIEALVTVFIALVLAAVAWELGKQAIDSLRAGHDIPPPGIAASVIALVSVLLKEILFRRVQMIN